MVPIDQEIQFLESFVVEPAVLQRNLESSASDLVKGVHEIMDILREDPEKLTLAKIEKVARDKKSQISNPEAFLGHSRCVASISEQLAAIIHEKVPGQDLVQPKVIYALGLAHDLSAIYAKYDNNPYTQEDKELTLYFHARHINVPLIANHAAMHSAYFEILEMIHEGSGFSSIELYREWTKILQERENKYNFAAIKSYFSGFLRGEDNLTLMVLTLADFLDNGKAKIDIATIDGEFKSRVDYILGRYYLNRVYNNQEPTALGIALLVRGGLKRVVQYKQSINNMLQK